MNRSLIADLAPTAATTRFSGLSSVVRSISAGGAVALALGHLGNDLFTGTLSALLPTLHQRLSLSEVWLATLAAVFSLGVAFP